MWPTHFSYNSHCVSYQHNKSPKCSWVTNRTSSSPAAACRAAGLPGSEQQRRREFTVQIMKSNIYCVLVCRAAASSLCVIRWSEAAAGRITSITRLLGTRTRLSLRHTEELWWSMFPPQLDLNVLFRSATHTCATCHYSECGLMVPLSRTSFWSPDKCK